MRASSVALGWFLKRLNQLRALVTRIADTPAHRIMVELSHARFRPISISTAAHLSWVRRHFLSNLPFTK